MKQKAAMVVLIINVMLFVVKLVGGIFSGSLALISDAANSFIDIIASIGVWYSIKVSLKKPDETHPFGHSRAEPIAGIIIAILTGILGIEILKSSFFSLLEAKSPFGLLPIVILLITIITKFILSIYTLRVYKKSKSPAIKASYIDSRNDILVSLVAIFGITGTNLGYFYFDSIAATFISIFILFSGYKIAIENIDFLMGKRPNLEKIQEIKSMCKVKGAIGVHDVKAHYVGNLIQVELHIEVDKDLSTFKSHQISKKIQKNIEMLEDVDRAFIHLDPR